MNALLVLLMLLTAAASAADVKTYRRVHQEGADAKDLTIIRIYIRGFSEGLQAANADLKDSNRPLLFCVPGKLVLEVSNYENIIDSEIELFSGRLKQPELDQMEIGILLLNGLQKTFPCQPIQRK